jgi:hypothetical protein
MIIFGLVWLIFLLVLSVVVVRSRQLRLKGVSVTPPRRRHKRQLWAGLGLDKAALDRVRAAGRSDAGNRAQRPITSGPVRCSAWRGRPHAQACNRLFEEIHRLDRLESRHKNIGLTRQQEETHE